MQGIRDEVIKILNKHMTTAVEKAVDEIMETVINKSETIGSRSASGGASNSIDNSKKPSVKIVRYSSDNECVLGKVYINGVFQMYSGERPWLNNKVNVSCIPEGKYKCTRHVTANYPEARRAYLINDVPGRSGILFHSGNIPTVDSSGCILLGLTFGKLNGKDAVLQSRDAMERFHEIINNREFDLEITSEE